MSLCLRGFVLTAASFVLRRFAGMFHQHRLRGFFDERFTDSSRRLALWFHIRSALGACGRLAGKRRLQPSRGPRHNWLVLERAIVKSSGRYVSLRETAR